MCHGQNLGYYKKTTAGYSKRPVLTHQQQHFEAMLGLVSGNPLAIPERYPIEQSGVRCTDALMTTYRITNRYCNRLEAGSQGPKVWSSLTSCSVYNSIPWPFLTFFAFIPWPAT